MLTLAAENSGALAGDVSIAQYIPVLPLLSLIICGALALLPMKGLRKFAAPVTIFAIIGAFLLSIKVFFGLGDISQMHAGDGVVVEAFKWIHAGAFEANFAFFIDPLTVVMLIVVTGVGSLIAIYASGYMAGDVGYARFFAYISLFILAMLLLVLSDNLLLLYLGWEGVGVASYLLIGFYYKKPSAVAAAKKAFIVNRIGDFGFALGIMLTFLVFGVIGYDALFSSIRDEQAMAALEGTWKGAALQWVPFLLMLGAFGKSAQLPLHVWLPDAMEGPTPVSALIHAATMVTAGVYMIARLMPVFQLNDEALYTVAVIGTLTALFAATVALCQFDIKRIWAYSTCSQLGYMFMGVGVLGTGGAVAHLFTHAFFKALLFLTAGSVMHALAGQLDLRKMSGLAKKMPITCWLMFAGCIALAGVPFTAGFYSKDEILYFAINKHPWMGVVGIGVALLTAFYTFRLWFRVFMGPEQYEMGDEHHGYSPTHHPEALEGAGHGHDDHGHGDDHHDDDHGHHGHHGPHEMPWLMNAPLIILAIGAIAFGFLFVGDIFDMVHHSSADSGYHPDKKAPGYVSHATVGIVSGGGAVLMIALAAYFHWLNREAGQKIARMFRPLTWFLENKWLFDELYNWVIVKPLYALGYVFYLVFDRFLLDGVVYDGLIQWTPRLFGEAQAPMQRGKLQGLAMTMGVGLLVVLAIVAYSVMV